MRSFINPKCTRAAAGGTLLIAALGFAGTAQAELEFNVGVFSDYLDDGESGSDNNAVVQGGVDYFHDSGFYLGTWMSTLGSGDGQEVNLYTGYELNAGALDFDLAYVYYYFPSLDDEDSGEIQAYASFGPVYAGLDYTIHADDSDARGDIIWRVGAGHEIVPSIGLDGEIGYFDPDSSDVDSHTFWNLGVTKSTDLGDISLTYGSTDQSGSQDLFVVGYSVRF
ncbi:hypothetical protein TVNIR_0590 [Thioalkalivibrio nitratireducens DSM 14787]|uniref:Porin n=1 Tax=Thioalkalivibrio nitratireducens (strain DSM 14787 / UNIQEM 213 / ALEN2) TaxID=1255043 RepID=L0DVA0_THIND|nr:TorF family putative porin [Thioalkalivibrio nitratireducens]AGA32291.1 hypothetical protein TVNIR_0590 [Thioalkalivibrio nitratireducens DSM 14787]